MEVRDVIMFFSDYYPRHTVGGEGQRPFLNKRTNSEVNRQPLWAVDSPTSSSMKTWRGNVWIVGTNPQQPKPKVKMEPESRQMVFTRFIFKPNNHQFSQTSTHESIKASTQPQPHWADEENQVQLETRKPGNSLSIRSDRAGRPEDGQQQNQFSPEETSDRHASWDHRVGGGATSPNLTRRIWWQTADFPAWRSF